MNPCAELPLLPYESCNLGSVNVARFVRDGAIDWSRLRGTIHLAVRFLDDVIEANRYPLPAIEAITKSNRKIGLGVMGFADLLVQLGVRYDSERALAVADELASFVQREARAASEELARARGPFPAWPGSLWAQRGDLPRRNATVSTVAPTGTISLIAGCSSGIEPLFALAYVRRALDGEALLRFVHPALGRVARERGFWSEELAESVARTGSLAHVESVPDEVRDVFRTSHEIAPEWHVRMQAAFQRHVENAVSKCIAEGTLIPTSRGLIRIESFSDIDTEGTFVPVTSGVTTGGRRVVSHYWQGVKPATRIRLDNGATLVGSTESHRVMTPEGWRRLVDLEPGDLVLGEFQESHGDGAQPIGWESAYRTNAKRVRVPERMSPTFAKFLGMLAADGHTVESTGNVGLTVADPVVEAEFIRLCEMLFEVTPRIVKDTRNDVRTASITSRNLARCVEMLIGKGAYEKRIPEQVLRGNPEEKLAFLTGLTLDGYVTRDGLCVYAGMSEELAYHASEICRSFGVPLVRVQRVFVKATDAWGWRVVVSNELQRRIVAIEAHKNVAATDVAFKVLVSPEDVARRSLSTKDPGYHNLRLLKQTSKPFCKNTVADELGLAWRRLVHRVSIVEDAGLVNLYDIEVEGDHTYVANGIVSHNTINLPTTATPDDVKRAYLLAYESGCKGITVYRDGSREAQVLSVPSSAPVAAGRKPRPRPEVTKGMTIKRRTGEGNLYVTINEDERGQPFELFATLGKAGGCMAAMTEAIARLVSLALRAGVDVDEVRKQLRGISCHPAWNDGVKVLSSPDAIAQAIELWQREKGHPVSDEVAPTRSGCPECGGTLEHAEGCTTCRACGFSECG